LDRDDLRQYNTLILPDCRFLTDAQAQLLQDYLGDSGSEPTVPGSGQLLVLGDLGVNLLEETRHLLLEHPRTLRLADPESFRLGHLASGLQARWSTPVDLAINVQRVAEGAAVHLIRYAYDAALDRVPALPELTLDLRLLGRYTEAEAISPGDGFEASLRIDGDRHHLSLRNVPLYSIVLLKE
jgi:hypothetical protein